MDTQDHMQDNAVPPEKDGASEENQNAREPVALQQSSPFFSLPKGIRRPLTTGITILAGMFLGIFIIYGILPRFQKEELPPPKEIIPTETPTPTPRRDIAPVATTSAFLSLEERIGSLSTEIRSFTTEDPALTPPDLTLPLGFSQR